MPVIDLRWSTKNVWDALRTHGGSGSAGEDNGTLSDSGTIDSDSKAGSRRSGASGSSIGDGPSSVSVASSPAPELQPLPSVAESTSSVWGPPSDNAAVPDTRSGSPTDLVSPDPATASLAGKLAVDFEESLPTKCKWVVVKDRTPLVSQFIHLKAEAARAKALNKRLAGLPMPSSRSTFSRLTMLECPQLVASPLPTSPDDQIRAANIERAGWLLGAGCWCETCQADANNGSERSRSVSPHSTVARAQSTTRSEPPQIGR